MPMALRSSGLKRLLGRVPQGVPSELITTFPTFGVGSALRRISANTDAKRTAIEVWSGQQFSKLVTRSGFHDAQVFFGYSGECLGQLKAARSTGLKTVVEQVNAPRLILAEYLKQEQERFPHWQEPAEIDPVVSHYNALEAAEWDAADLVLCGSEFVRRSIAQQGGPVERCVVVPYGVSSAFKIEGRRRHDGPLRVLTVGEVGLRKGSRYVMEAACMTKGMAEFRMVGSCNLQPEARKALASVVDLRGVVPRSEIYEHYRWADVFLLPSICEGSATVVYEALAADLPVITTLNTGTVVRDGIEGFIVPIRDPESIAQAVLTLARDADLWTAMSRNAGARAKNFDLQNYGRRLEEAIEAISSAA
jgi:glycosyltransferase involved in cell wall biosynthesis